MPETTAYFDSICAERSQLLTEDEQLEGASLVSIETCEEFVDKTDKYTYTFVLEHFADFLGYLRYLKPVDQELLLEYYVLGKPQNALAITHRATQTVMSFRIRLAVRAMACCILMGVPNQGKISEVLKKAGLEEWEGSSSAFPIWQESKIDFIQAPGSVTEKLRKKKLPLSQILDEYQKCRSFQRVADVHRLHRPSVRRAISNASKVLRESKDQEQQALGAWIFSLIDKANPVGRGLSKRQAKKRGNIEMKDPSVLGQFRIDVTDPGFDSMFIAKANR